MRLLRSLIDFHGRRVPFANGSLPLIMTVQKRSSSQVHQTDEEYMARGIAAFLSRPQNAQDGERRGRRRARLGRCLLSLAWRIVGPACSHTPREAIMALCAQHWWEITKFSSLETAISSSKCFSSRTDKQDSEDVDAFTVQSRNQSESWRFHRHTMLPYNAQSVQNFSEFIRPVGCPTVERRVDVRPVITY
jgi:hypothetical protein